MKVHPVHQFLQDQIEQLASQIQSLVELNDLKIKEPETDVEKSETSTDSQ